MMPRLFKDMPAPKPGRWVAVVQKTYAFREPKEVWSKEVTGLRRAYLLARIMALVEDLSTPYFDGEVGINWAVRKAQ